MYPFLYLALNEFCMSEFEAPFSLTICAGCIIIYRIDDVRKLFVTYTADTGGYKEDLNRQFLYLNQLDNKVNKRAPYTDNDRISHCQ